MADAFLALGSNLGDRAWHLAEAVRRLRALPQTQVTAMSSVYASPPVGYTDQPEFLNAVIRLSTALSPHDLLARGLAIESALGRVRRERWGPRPIDIDLLLYDALVVAEPALTVPHPRMRERSFVLVPLAEIAPGLVIAGETVETLVRHVDPAGLRKLGPLPPTAAP